MFLVLTAKALDWRHYTKLDNITINLSHLESPLISIWIKQGHWQACLPGYNDLGTGYPKVILPTADHNSRSNTVKVPTVSPNEYYAPRQGRFSCTLWLCCSNDRRGGSTVDRLVHRMNRWQQVSTTADTPPRAIRHAYNNAFNSSLKQQRTFDVISLPVFIPGSVSDTKIW